MKIQLLSDLHLEVQPGFTLRPAPDADLLVLAGDVGSYQYGSHLPGADFGLERFSPLRGWPVPVLYVPGNHEYDAVEFDATHARLRETCERLGITWLERETLVVGGKRFIGTTLWSDFDALAVQARPAQQLKARSPGGCCCLQLFYGWASWCCGAHDWQTGTAASVRTDGPDKTIT